MAKKITDYLMGKNMYMWRDGAFQTIEFVVTQECNMRCKYCYMDHKNNENIMSIETAKKAIDYFIEKESEELFSHDALSINFIGGEPLLEIDLIDKICDYFKVALYEKNHKWFNMFIINIGSNGLLYETRKVQQFLRKNKEKVSINVTIDGTKEKHDLQRIYPDGSGTYDDVLRNVKLWMMQYPNSKTKVTIGNEDLKYLKDSIVYLWNLGMKEVPANIVFENIWDIGDDELYYTQLKDLADYIIDNHLWDTHNTTLFSERLGAPLTEGDLNGRECGSGGMVTIDAKGLFYPCVRFMDYSLNNQKSISIGNITDGLNLEKVRPFVNCDLLHQSDKECLNCSIASDCSYCLAHNYDVSDGGTLFQRNKFICKMHKARVRADNYYWTRLENETGEVISSKNSYQKTLFIMLSDDSAEFCNYDRLTNKNCLEISEKKLELAAKFVDNNFFNPVLVHSKNIELSNRAINYFTTLRFNNISFIDTELMVNDKLAIRNIVSLSKDDVKNISLINSKAVVLLVKEDELNCLAQNVESILNNCIRINIVLKFDLASLDYEEYEHQLMAINDIIFQYLSEGEIKQVDIITDGLFQQKSSYCSAGVESYTLAPNGLIYPCPAFYYNDPNFSIGSINDGIDESLINRFKIEASPICENCSTSQCKKCVFQNKERTGEYNTPSSLQCKKTIIEDKVSYCLFERLVVLERFYGKINNISVNTGSDPIEQLVTARGNLKTFKYRSLLNS